MSNVKDFLKRKDIVITPQRYLIEALGAMAQGLFASLLIGTIIKTLGQQTGLETLVDLGGYATAMSGPAMAVAIGWALHCPPLVLFSLVTVGYSSNALGGAGGPLAVLIIAIVAAELGKAVSKETRVDILVTPLVTIFAGVGLSMLIAAPIGAAASQVGTLIMWATEQAPFLMGILVSVIVGVALTLPISSAAICAALGLTGLAGGAAVAGCCAQMIGFAVMSYKENGVGGLISQGLGTSMLQMGNIVKNPRISVVSLLYPLTLGAAVYTVGHQDVKHFKVFELLEKYQLTFATVTPSLLQLLSPYFDEINLPSLKYLGVSAEASQIELLERFRKSAPNATFINLYGPTEATIYCTCSRMPSSA